MNWSALAKTGLSIAGILVPQIGNIEQLAKAIPTLRGQAKEDAAVALTKEALEATEGFAGKELLSDPAVEAASRAFIQGYVALQGAVAASKALLPTASPIPPTQN